MRIGRSEIEANPNGVALGWALRMDQVERGHLKLLTRSAECSSFKPEVMPQWLQRIFMVMRQPAYVTGRRWPLFDLEFRCAGYLCF